MKRLSLLAGIMLVACMLQNCNNGAGNANNSADTANAEQDTSTTINLTVDKEDAQFAVEAANGGLTEVELGKLAIQNGLSKKVRNYGAMMVKDHNKINSRLMAIAEPKKLNLPVATDTAGQKNIAELSKKTGKDFDNAYIKDMMEDHQKDVAAFTNVSRTCQDPDLKAFAIKTLPILQKHLDAIIAIHDSME